MGSDSQSNQSNNLGTEDIVDLLNDDKDTSDKENKNADEDTTDKDIESEEEDEDIIEEDETEDEESEDEDKKKEDEDDIEVEEEDLITPPRKKEILKAYPDLFKKFPYLEKALYRDRQFSEVFPDVDTAKEASEKADVFDSVEHDINEGNIEKIIQSVKDSGEKALNRLADDYLDTLRKVDRESYLHVVAGVIKQAITAMAEGSNDGEDEDLLNAAKTLNKFMFNTDKFQAHGRLSEARNPESERLNKDKQNWDNQKFETSKNELMGKVKSLIQSTVSNNIDKKDAMTSYVKKNAVNDAMQSLDNVMSKDKSFQRFIDNLWKNAKKDNYSTSSVEKIRSAYIGKAKTLLPGVITKARNEALKGLPGKTREERDRKGILPRKGPESGNRNNRSDTKSPQKGESTLDYFNRD